MPAFVNFKRRATKANAALINPNLHRDLDAFFRAAGSGLLR